MTAYEKFKSTNQKQAHSHFYTDTDYKRLILIKRILMRYLKTNESQQITECIFK